MLQGFGNVPYPRHQHDQSKKSIYYGRNTCQKFCCHLQWTIDLLRTIMCLYTDVRIPIGTPKIIAPAVTYRLPTIIGRIPKILFFGLHSVPLKNFPNPISFIAGSPFAKRNIQISATASTEAQAAMKNTPRMKDSFHALCFIYLATSSHVSVSPV